MKGNGSSRRRKMIETVDIDEDEINPRPERIGVILGERELAVIREAIRMFHDVRSSTSMPEPLSVNDAVADECMALLRKLDAQTKGTEREGGKG